MHMGQSSSSTPNVLAGLAICAVTSVSPLTAVLGFADSFECSTVSAMESVRATPKRATTSFPNPSTISIGTVQKLEIVNKILTKSSSRCYFRCFNKLTDMDRGVES